MTSAAEISGTLSIVVQNGQSPLAMERAGEADQRINELFFPEYSRENSGPFGYSYVCLNYLASLAGERRKSPLTLRQFQVIRTNVQEECRAYWGLRVGVVVSVLVTLGLAYLAFALSDDSSNGKKGGVYTAIGLVGSALVCLSWWGTGFEPKKSNDTGDVKQDGLYEMQELYKDLAFGLMRFYFSAQREDAIRMAQRIDQVDLKAVVERAIRNPVRAAQIVNVLLQGVRYVVSEERELPYNEQLLNCITNHQRVYSSRA